MRLVRQPVGFLARLLFPFRVDDDVQTQGGLRLGKVEGVGAQSGVEFVFLAGDEAVEIGRSQLLGRPEAQLRQIARHRGRRIDDGDGALQGQLMPSTSQNFRSSLEHGPSHVQGRGFRVHCRSNAAGPRRRACLPLQPSTPRSPPKTMQTADGPSASHFSCYAFPANLHTLSSLCRCGVR